MNAISYAYFLINSIILDMSFNYNMKLEVLLLSVFFNLKI